MNQTRRVGRNFDRVNRFERVFNFFKKFRRIFSKIRVRRFKILGGGGAAVQRVEQILFAVQFLFGNIRESRRVVGEIQNAVVGRRRFNGFRRRRRRTARARRGCADFDLHFRAQTEKSAAFHLFGFQNECVFAQFLFDLLQSLAGRRRSIFFNIHHSQFRILDFGFWIGKIFEIFDSS